MFDKIKEMFQRDKKGQSNAIIGSLLALGLGIMVLGISMAFGQDITGDIKDDFTANTLEYNSTNDAQLGMAEITEKTPTIAKVGVAVVIIGMIVAGFGGYFALRG